MKKIYYTLLGVLLTIHCWSQTIPDPELLYYKFDEVGTNVTNFATNPPVGTAVGVLEGSLSQGSVGQCNGALIGSGNSSTSDYLNTGWAPTLDGSVPWTISFWTSNISGTSTLYYIFGDVNSGSFRCFTNGVAGANNWILRGGFADVLVGGGAIATPTMTTFVYDPIAGNIKAYLNGALVNTVAQTSAPINGAGPFKVGGYGASTGLNPGGLMDEFRLYDRAISAAEVLQLYERSISATVSINACESYTSPSGNFTWTTSGTYLDTIPNSYCGDSLMTINLTINQPTADTLVLTACNAYDSPSGNYTWTTSGTYYDTITNMMGCDSLLTINLTINQSTFDTIYATACNFYDSPSGNYTWMSSGTYYDTLPNMVGCDSLFTVYLTINQATGDTLDITECDFYDSPSGNYTWTSSGTYYDTIANMAGCDSLLMINLTINQSSSSTISPVVCDSYTAPDNMVYTTSGNYAAILTNAAGCDSTINIQLTVFTIDTNVTVSGATLTSATANATSYQWINCTTQSPIAGATSSSFTATTNGTYAVEIVNGPCAETSECVTIANIGIAENNVELVSAYPNPVSNILTVSNVDAKTLTIRLLDYAGKEISIRTSNEKELSVDMRNLATGIYLLKVTHNGSEQTIKVIRN